MASLEIKDLTYGYPGAGRPALEGLSFTLGEGELLLVAGKTGSGKTALIRALSERLGRDNVGYVPQDVSVQATDTVEAELYFPLCSRGVEPCAARRAVAEAAGRFGITGIVKKKLSDISGGERQLVSLAASTVTSPAVLLLDEPTANLDPVAASSFIASLKRYLDETGASAVIAEHRSDLLFPVADRLIVVDGGRAVFYGAPSEFCRLHGEIYLSLLPSPAKLYSLIGASGEVPLTVASARSMLSGYRIKPTEYENNAHTGAVLLTLRGVSFRYKKDLPDVLSGLDLEVCRGEHIAVFGANGAGKSTLLKILAGLSKPYAGKVKFHGGRGSVAYLPQDVRCVFLCQTVREELTSLSLPLGDFEKYADRHPYDLSGGEAKLLALKLVTASAPDLLLLDEPTCGLDAGEKAKLAGVLSDIAASGAAIVTITHDPEFASLSCSSCGLLFGGSLTGKTPFREFFAVGGHYSPAAAKIAKGIVPGAVLPEEIAEAVCREN